ncbi:MAG: FeoB-associated Cys-rich membrane protein [Clostridiales bacterium]|jgi:hypothetical protein|nr:FeoB-associated Cys-rich membrane protein [Clostridiales bacterium]
MMNWIDWIVAGVIIVLTVVIVVRGVLKRRKKDAPMCSGCPYANECVRGGDCPRKTGPKKQA